MTETTHQSMEIYSNLSNAISRINAAWSPAQIWSSVKDFADVFGYSNVVAVDAAKIDGGVTNALIYSDTPRQLFETIDKECIYAQLPFVQKARNSSEPFLVSDIRNQSQYAGKRWTDYFIDLVKRGEGLIVPVFQGAEPKAGFSFGGEKPDTSAMARSMLQVIAHAAIDMTFELNNAKTRPPKPTLSVREEQCLRWVAIGRADADIGNILGISPRTVRFHVDSAKTKLGVTTRIQAVAKALRERMIAV
ncbi:MAG: LuxR family transcriptional regulator [Alphaproteobacteria bacterium]|nr:LuxR family transcriptional regulator [Alphaproteobacteria bacterium]